MVKMSFFPVEDYIKFFHDADVDKDGMLTFDELHTKLSSNKEFRMPDKNLLKKWFDSCDITDKRDGKITLQEFLVVFGSLAPEEASKARARGLFNSFDLDGSGKVSAAEMKAVFKDMGNEKTDDEIKRMIALADKDKTGTLEIEELLKHVWG